MSEELLHYPFPRSPHGGPPPLYATLREEKPVCPFRAPSGDTVHLVTRYEDAKVVLSDPRFSRELNYPGAPRLASGPDFNSNPHSLLNIDPPEHSRLRKVLNPVFTPRAVEAYRSSIEGHVNGLLDAAAEGTRPADLYSAFAVPLATGVMCDFLGIAAEERAQIADALTLQMSVTASAEQKASAALHIENRAADLVAAKQLTPDAGLISTMIASERMSKEEIVATTALLLLFGNDTTPPTLTTSIVTLLRHPDVLARVTADPSLWPKAVEELVRYRSNGDFAVLRVVTEEVALSDTTLRPGDAVMAPVFAAQTDPAITERPEEFDLDREKVPPIQYGHGPRFCLGASLVRVVLATALETLFRRFPNLALAVPLDELEWSDDEFLIHVRELPVNLHGAR